LYTKHDICAVIVSYNCDDVIRENVKALERQVEQIIIVDNASSKASKDILFSIIGKGEMPIIYNAENNGIGCALNQGLEYAMKNNFRLLLTMDQDTVLCDDAVQKMIDVLNLDTSIVSVGPIYQTGQDVTNKPQYKKVAYLITSGNLTSVDSAVGVGGYNEKMFIDSIDFDFSLTMQTKGHSIAKANQAYMKHKIGEKEKAKFLFFQFEIFTHSSLRHYYIYRNHMYIMKKYFFKYPVFCCKKQVIMLLYTLQVLFIQSHKKEKLSMMYRGIKDAISKRYGSFS